MNCSVTCCKQETGEQLSSSQNSGISNSTLFLLYSLVLLPLAMRHPTAGPRVPVGCPAFVHLFLLL